MSQTTLLSAAQLADYERQGFVVVEDVFSPQEVAQMSQAFDRLARTAVGLCETTMVDGSQFVVDASTAPAAIKRVVWCGAAEPVLSRFGRDPRLVDLTGQLMGARQMEQLINQAHFKFPGDQVRFEWHQDSVHRRYGTDLWTDVDGREASSRRPSPSTRCARTTARFSLSPAAITRAMSGPIPRPERCPKRALRPSGR